MKPKRNNFASMQPSVPSASSTGETWDVRMFTLKNALSNEALRALCIFRIEVVNQPALHLVQIRSPKSPELMAAIEDAVKRLDVPPTPPPVSKGIELTGFVVVAMDPVDPQMLPLPAALQPVAAQLKSILPNGALALADTFVVRGVERQPLSLQGNTTLQGSPSIRYTSGASVIRLDNLGVQTRDTRGEYDCVLSDKCGCACRDSGRDWQGDAQQARADQGRDSRYQRQAAGLKGSPGKLTWDRDNGILQLWKGIFSSREYVRLLSHDPISLAIPQSTV